MNIGFIQPPYPSANYTPAQCVEYMLRLLGEMPGGQDLIVLPEYANCQGISERNELLSFMESHTQNFLDSISSAARNRKTAIAVNILASEDNRHLNKTLLFNREGRQVFQYVKTHLSLFEADELKLTPGDGQPVFNMDGIRLAFMTCFDIYFAEFAEQLASQEPDLVIFPSYQRAENADVIRRQAMGRALDLEAFIIRASYSFGADSATGGHSLLVDPCGNILIDAGQKTGFFTCSIDPSLKRPRPTAYGLAKMKSRRIIEQCRRPELYRRAGPGTECVRTRPFPRVVAHRGLSGLCPENTLPAFTAAIGAGADEIELDLQLSSDSELVVHHDPTLDRRSNGKGPIRERSWADIKKLDSGAWMGEKWRNTPPCRLEDVFKLCGGRAVMNIHVKEAGPEGLAIERVRDLARRYNLCDSIYLAGGKDVLEWSRRLAPEIERCCLEGQRDGSIVDNAIAFECRRVQFWNPNFDKEKIERAHAQGILCNLFYADKPEEADALYAQGIDAILTNYTNLILPVAVKYKTKSP
ncbi:glycerophosphodiester phosphodiesterase family protein [Verrucomicrobiota bacterium]